METELLHVQKGDKKKKHDTATEAGRQEAAQFIAEQIRKGTALFLCRGKKTYRIQSYDPKTDHLIVVAEVKGEDKKVRTKAGKAKVAGVPPIAGGAA